MTTTDQNAAVPAPKGAASSAVDSLVRMCEERFTPVLGREHGTIDWPAFALGVRAACLKNPALVTAIQQNPATLIQALSQAASLGLSPHPDLHHFYLIPFKNQIQAITGYRGLMELALRSGLIEDIQSFVIYKDEAEGLREARLPLIDPRTGEPNIHPDNRLLDGVERTDADIVGAIAVVRSKGRSRPITRAMTRAEIDKRRLAGQGNTPAWKGWFGEMACKTVIRSVLRSGRVPLGQQHDRIREAMEEEIHQAQATVVTTPAKQLDHRPSEFERRMDDPFPPGDEVLTGLLEDLWTKVDRAGMDADGLQEMVAKRFDGRMLDDLDVDEVRGLVEGF